MGEPDLQGRLDAAEEAVQMLCDRNVQLSAALHDVSVLAAAARHQAVFPHNLLREIVDVCEGVLWTPARSGGRDVEAGW